MAIKENSFKKMDFSATSTDDGLEISCNGKRHLVPWKHAWRINQDICHLLNQLNENAE